MSNSKEIFFAILISGCLAASAEGQLSRLGAEGAGSRDGWKFYATYFVEPRLAPGQHISIQGHDNVTHEDGKDGKPTVFHRFFIDPESKTYIGYDVEVEPMDKPGFARLRFKPLSLRGDQLPDRPVHGKQKEYETAELRALPAPQFPAETFPSAKMIAVDILKNPFTGQRVVDYVEVSYEPIRTPSKDEQRDLRVDDVILNITAPTLRVNGAEMPEGIVASWSLARKLVWLSVPGRGRFLLSLAPYAGYSFQKAGVVNASSISFTVNGDRYEWRSREAITESSGNWNIYVLSEPPNAGETARQEFTYGAVNSVEEFLSSAQ